MDILFEFWRVFDFFRPEKNTVKRFPDFITVVTWKIPGLRNRMIPIRYRWLVISAVTIILLIMEFVSKKLSLLCWNIWFEEFEFEIRYRHIFSLIESNNYDIICFQEVTPPLIAMIREQGWLTRYDCSDHHLDGRSVLPYGVMTLCKRNLSARFSEIPFPTNMYRKLLLTEICCGDGQSFCIGNVHLESLDNPSLRQQQLAICKQNLDQFDTSVLCGDFNFCSYRNFERAGKKLNVPLENDSMKVTMPNYIDVWPLLVPRVAPETPVNLYCTPPSKPAMSPRFAPDKTQEIGTNDASDDSMGYTFDTERNIMIHRLPSERMRYDRVMCKEYTSTLASGRQNIWHPTAIYRVGMAPIDGHQPSSIGASKQSSPRRIYPSDHFGLVTEFTALLASKDITRDMFGTVSIESSTTATATATATTATTATLLNLNAFEEDVTAGTSSTTGMHCSNERQHQAACYDHDHLISAVMDSP